MTLEFWTAIAVFIGIFGTGYWQGRRSAMRECETWLKEHDLFVKNAKNAAYLASVARPAQGNEK